KQRGCGQDQDPSNHSLSYFLGGGGGASGMTRFRRQAIASATFGSLFFPFFVQASRTSFSRFVQAMPNASRYQRGTYRSCRAVSWVFQSLLATPSYDCWG